MDELSVFTGHLHGLFSNDSGGHKECEAQFDLVRVNVAIIDIDMIEIIRKIWKPTKFFQDGSKCEPTAISHENHKLMWKFANDVKMDLSADQRQYSMKIREKMGKLANIAKMSISAGQCR